MTVTSFTRGHWIPEPFDDNIPCARCGRMPGPDGRDACLPHIEGVTAACCGHGDPDLAGVMFEDGRSLSGKEAFEYLQQYRDEAQV